MSNIDNEIFKFVVSFHMKSGKCFYLYCDDMEYKHNGGVLSSYSTTGQDTRFLMINLEEVEFMSIDFWNKPRGDLVK